MYKGIKKILASLLLGCVAICSFDGCSIKNNKAKIGRYEEKELSRIDGITNIYSIRELKGKKFFVIGSDEDGNFKCFESNDDGKSFTQKEVKINPESSGDFVQVNNGYIDKDGVVYLNCNEFTNENKKRLDEIESKEGELTDDEMNEEVKIYNEAKKLLYKVDTSLNSSIINHDDIKDSNYETILGVNNNNIYLSYDKSSDNDINCSIVQIDMSNGKIKNELKISGDTAYNGTIVGDKLVCSLSSGTKCYDLNSLKETSKLKNFNKDQYENNEIFQGEDNKTLYSVKDKGLYKYNLKTQKLSNIIEGSLSSFGDRNMYFNTATVTGNNKIIAAFSDEEGNVTLYKYTYNKDLASKPDKEITVYSLYNNGTLDSAVNGYMKKHKDVYVKCEYGIEDYGNDSTTENDAIKKLNTELMAGKGPDIVFLDGIDSSKYVKKGIFADLESVLKEHKKEMLKNVVKAYKSKDNKIYEVPLSIEIPVITGKNVSEINDLESLNKAVLEASKKGEKNIMNLYDAKQFLYVLYYSCAGSWIKDDNTINKDKLKTFLKESQSIYKTCTDSNTDSVKNKLKKYIAEIKKQDLSYNYYEYYLLNDGNDSDFMFEDTSLYNLGYFYSDSDLAICKSLSNKGEKLDYNIWEGQIGKYFIPSEKVAVNSKSKHIDDAKDFVSYLLSDKYQSTSFSTPVNKNALKKSIKERNNSKYGGYGSMCYGDNGENELKIKNLDKDTIKKFISDIESLDSVCYSDKIILNQAEDEFVNYISGKNNNLDDAVNKISDKLQIALSE